jgi:hypothetical protein
VDEADEGVFEESPCVCPIACGVIITIMKEITQEQWAFLGGILEGEGCISGIPGRRQDANPSWHARIGVGQKYPELLYFLQSQFGGKVWSVPYNYAGRGFSPPPDGLKHTWTVGDAATIGWILRGTIPYLFRKQIQARVALTLISPPKPPKDKQYRLAMLLKALKRTPYFEVVKFEDKNLAEMS